jgi:hypothetical protein
VPLFVTMRVPVSRDSIRAALEGLCALNFQVMRQAIELGGGFPPLYESPIVYRKEKRGYEDWQNAIELLRAGRGDCEELAGYRVAELRNDGEPAMPFVDVTPRGSFHALVERANGELEDPSRILLALEVEERGLGAVRSSLEREFAPPPPRRKRALGSVGMELHELGELLLPSRYR